MRFEAKHRVGKKAAATSSSRVNICYTTAKRLQLQLNSTFVTNSLRPPLFHTSLGISAHSSATKGLRLAFNIPDDALITSHSFVTSPANVTYRRRDVITITLDPDDMLYPKFAQIDALYFARETGECYAHCRWLQTKYFDNHFYAYFVTSSLESIFIQISQLEYVFPNSMVHTSGSERSRLMVVDRNWLL